MTLVVPRMIGAVAGFIDKHGTLPTRMIVPAENWAGYRADRSAVPLGADEETARAVFAMLHLIPVPHQLYIAVDDEGHWFDCGSEGTHRSDAWRRVREALGAAAAGQERAAEGSSGAAAPGDPPPRAPSRPIEDSYVVPGSRLVAGQYPGSPPETPAPDARRKLEAFLDVGIRAFVDLTQPRDRLAPYERELRALAAARAADVWYERLEIPDNDVCEPGHMRRILDAVDAHLAAGRTVYVHCHGGVGRTGLVVGCWLVRHGHTGESALAQVDALFRTMSREKVQRHRQWGSPQTEAQRRMVRDFAGHDRPARGASPREHSVTSDIDLSLRARYAGALLGLAVGDALGTTLEFTRPGTFTPIDDMVGGGPFGLRPGQWTDDTSMALCLGESLLECRGFDAEDQMRRYVRWIEEGHWSSTGRCFDVGTVVRRAVAEFRRTGRGFSGPTEEHTAGNGSLMRLAPAALYFAADPALAIRMAGDSSRTTHGTAAAVDACRYFAGLLVGALRGASKEELLAPRYTPVAGLWEREPLHPAVSRVASGSFRHKAPPDIRGGGGYVIDTLEAALWAFATTSDFASGALAAVNLGGDADTTGAVYGQIAGAHYGVEGIPERWRTRVARGGEIGAMAEELHGAAGWGL